MNLMDMMAEQGFYHLKNSWLINIMMDIFMGMNSAFKVLQCNCGKHLNGFPRWKVPKQCFCIHFLVNVIS